MLDMASFYPTYMNIPHTSPHTHTHTQQHRVTRHTVQQYTITHTLDSLHTHPAAYGGVIVEFEHVDHVEVKDVVELGRPVLRSDTTGSGEEGRRGGAGVRRARRAGDGQGGRWG